MEKDKENQKPAEEMSLKFFSPAKIFALEAFLFSLTLFFGVVSAFKLNQILKIEEITTAPISFWQFLFYFLISTLFILLIIIFGKSKSAKGVIFKGIFIMAVGFGGILFLSLWLPDIFALILIGILIFWWFKKPTVLIHDLLIIFGISGIGSFLGLRLEPLMILSLLILFSIYDFIAVYKTKHMVKMAKEMIESRAILALIIPPDLRNFQENLEKVRPGGKFLILGGGDIAFPLLFCASLVPFGILNSLIVAIFSLIGLLVGFFFFISQKVRRPIPALPPIALFSIIGFLITRIL